MIRKWRVENGAHLTLYSSESEAWRIYETIELGPDGYKSLWLCTDEVDVLIVYQYRPGATLDGARFFRRVSK
jgi:hypothetical protein